MVHGAFLRAKLWDELRLFVAPKIFGADAISWAGFMGRPLDLQLRAVERVGSDALLWIRPAGATGGRGRGASRRRGR